MVPPITIPTGAPAFIPVGNFNREQRVYARPWEVRTHTDLPQCVHVGDIDPSSFTTTADGWSVQYTDATPETGVSMSYDRLNDLLELRQQWRGVPGPSLQLQISNFRVIAAANPFPFPKAWDDAVKPRLESRYNVWYAPADLNSSQVTFFPDLAFRDIFVPVPVCRLRAVVDLYDRLMEDVKGVGNGSVYLARTSSVISYVRGRCSEQLSNVIGIWCHILDTTGFGQGFLPALEQGDDGTSALSIGRAHYLAVVTCRFRDLERVMSQIHQLGLIQDADAVDDPPVATEHLAIVGNYELEALQAKVALWDRAKSRRISYDPLVPEAVFTSRAAAEAMDNICLDDTLRMIEQAECESYKYTSNAEMILSDIVDRYKTIMDKMDRQ